MIIKILIIEEVEVIITEITVAEVAMKDHRETIHLIVLHSQAAMLIRMRAIAISQKDLAHSVLQNRLIRNMR